MPTSSISLLHYQSPPSLRLLFSISGSSKPNSTKPSRKSQPQRPSKHLLKARETVKHSNTLSPLLSPDDDTSRLAPNQSIGMVASSQANFMRVVVQFPRRNKTHLEDSTSFGEQFEKVVESRGSLDQGNVDLNGIQGFGNYSESLNESFGEVGGGNMRVDKVLSRDYIEKIVENRGKLDQGNADLNGNQGYGRSEALDEDRDELEASRSSASGDMHVDEVNEDLNGDRNEFVKIEGSGSSGEVSGVQFLQCEGSIERLEKNGDGLMELDDGFGRLGEGNQLEASRSSGEVDEGSWNEGKRGVELLCVVKAVLKKIKRRVLVGDRVLVGSIDWIDRRGMIENVYERKSEVLDPPVANVDHLVVLFSMDQPKIEPFALTRFLVEAESTGIPFFLALNKSELVSEETLLEWKSRLSKWGYVPVFCSIESKRGLDTLQFRLREQTSVIVGPSGVGKSSLINALRGNNPSLGVQQDDSCLDNILGSKWLEEQRVGEISMRSGRGKHTTRHVSLLPLTGGGYLADTPGFNQPSLIKVTKQSLAQHFPEIRKMLEDSELKKCSFSNCLHVGEPGCVVKGDWERYPYYLQLLDEIRIREEFQLRTVGTKREGDVRYKTGEMGVVQAEPRLEMKKHRRQSRKKVNQSFMDDLDESDEDDDENLLDENPVIRAVREEQQ